MKLFIKKNKKIPSQGSSKGIALHEAKLNYSLVKLARMWPAHKTTQTFYFIITISRIVPEELEF